MKCEFFEKSMGSYCSYCSRASDLSVDSFIYSILLTFAHIRDTMVTMKTNQTSFFDYNTPVGDIDEAIYRKILQDASRANQPTRQGKANAHTSLPLIDTVMPQPKSAKSFYAKLPSGTKLPNQSPRVQRKRGRKVL